MIVVSFDKEMRGAFEAGRSAGIAILRGKVKDPAFAAFLAAVPKTYDEWIESIRDRPAVVRGSMTNCTDHPVNKDRGGR